MLLTLISFISILKSSEMELVLLTSISSSKISYNKLKNKSIWPDVGRYNHDCFFLNKTSYTAIHSNSPMTDIFVVFRLICVNFIAYINCWTFMFPFIIRLKLLMPICLICFFYFPCSVTHIIILNKNQSLSFRGCRPRDFQFIVTVLHWLKIFMNYAVIFWYFCFLFFNSFTTYLTCTLSSLKLTFSECVRSLVLLWHGI